MTPADAAALITAIGGIIWPLVGLALRKHLGTMADSIAQRCSGIKLAGCESSVAEATAQQQKLIADLLSARDFAIIIARMAISGRSDAGVGLVERVRAIDPTATIYLITGPNARDAHGKDALTAGAQFVTDSPAELIRQLTRLE